ncbi:MAG: hypothetical protein CMH46_15770 [Muricauda sp.]|nr:MULTISPECIES: STAS domain-containing protein [unclassified Allomuricauda]MAU16986.1 hypothetical protein [Allomuricauda sp.]|tara:strand:+ start:1687 stop:1965 length:279 start_codon:yes stop_codon:yes gene_type:complete
MALQITESRRVFSVNGNLNSANIKIFERHMRNFIKRGAIVVLDLQKVTQIDDLAGKALIQMFANALILDCQFTIKGGVPKNLMHELCLEAKL